MDSLTSLEQLHEWKTLSAPQGPGKDGAEEMLEGLERDGWELVSVNVVLAVVPHPIDPRSGTQIMMYSVTARRPKRSSILS